MHVLFVEPSFPADQREFVRALRDAGGRVTGIGEVPLDHLDAEVRHMLYGYEHVPSVCDEGAMLRAVRAVQAREWVDRLEATVEAHILPVARVREAATIPGISERTAFLCRDKPAMKQALRDAGVATAASAGASSGAELRAFAARIGYPVIVKPRGGAGAADTTRVDDERQLEATIAAHHLDRAGGHASVAVEEFVEGHEAFYDTLSIDGEVRLEFISHYYPGVLEAMRNRWISPYLITTNRLEEPGYREVREMGRRVIAALGIRTSATHMEWFFGPKGLKFSEIGCRPPGVAVWQVYSAANEFDLHREWALAVMYGRTETEPSRRYSAGMIALRPDADGRIAGYEGWDRIQSAFGEWIIDAHLPPPGTPTQPIEAGYMANAWVRMRHPDYDELRSIFDTVGRTVRVKASRGQT